MKLQLKIDSNPSPTSRKGHALFNLAIKDPSPSTKTSSEKKKKKPRFQLNELDLGEINRTSSLNVSNRTPEGPTMSLNATTFRFRSKLVVTKDGFRTADLDENVTRSDFCIVKELGRGAGGVVYKAVHLETLRVVAIKYVRANDAQKRSQIWHELQSLTENFEPLRDKFVPLRFCSNEDLLRWLHTIHFGPYSKQVVYINNMKNTKLFKTGRFGALLESCKGHTDLSEFIPKSTLHQKLLFRAITQANEAGGIRLPPKCPYIISFHGAYLDPERSNSVCIVIEYMDGGDLQGFLDAGVHCTETLIASIAFRMLRALGFLHSRNQAHRDIKPANALLTQRGDVKVSDYGIAKKITKDEEFKTFTGTTMYMSPERLDGLNYTVNADIWSLGITLMSLFMGRVPFSSKAKASFFNLRNEIVNNTLPRLEGASKEFQSFVDRCTCVDSKKRADVNELLSHDFIVSHVDEIYDTRDYKRWIKDRLEKTKLENTKKMKSKTLMEHTERKKRDALSEMVTVAKSLSKRHIEEKTKVVGDEIFQNNVLRLALVLCGEFSENDAGENRVAKKAIKKFGKVLRKSGVLKRAVTSI